MNSIIHKHVGELPHKWGRKVPVGIKSHRVMYALPVWVMMGFRTKEEFDKTALVIRASRVRRAG